MKRRDRVINLTQNLIRINSENPLGSERDIAEYICKFLKRFGYKPRIVEFVPGRSNVTCLIKSRNSLKRILISPHLDTVPAGPGWKVPPFSGKILKRKIYGRGASDCKGNLAVTLAVLASLRKQRIVFDNLDIIFAATADEETGSLVGFKPLLKRIKPLDYALVLDGSNFEITYAQKGLLHLRIIIYGKKAHGAYPERGVNAIDKAAKALIKINEWAVSVNRLYRKAELSVNAGRIEGGQKVNIVADKCIIDLDFRFSLNKDTRFFTDKLRKLIKKVSKNFRLDVLNFQRPAETCPDNILIKTLKSSLRSKNINPVMQVCKGATVLNFLTEKKIPSAVFGFSSKKQAHATDEYIEIANLKKGVVLLKDFLTRLDKRIG
ncbi:MAG: ArgE/DapE family deacylase [Candidatus Omnitrophica bacterium]|nr:ArgE/DapE family deacylase [Candidatus Omnitrophota bacterium]